MTAVIVKPNSCILFVKTEKNFSQVADLNLREAGYSTATISDTSSGLEELNELQPAMVVLDYIRAGEAGVNFCRKLRRLGSRIPILMLLDEETVAHRVACLEAGADDYLLKPYNATKFLQIVQLYLKPKTNNIEQLCFGELLLDLTTRRIFRNGREIDLTMKEFELLKYLMSHPQEVLTREQILENVWGYDFRGESNVIEVYIRYLRLKIENEGQKRLIQTVRGVGYVLRES